MVGMVIRSTRYRYPITSEQINDGFDEVYSTLVDILGYQDNDGDIAVSGGLREAWAAVDAARAGTFGSSASGVPEAYTYSSGTLDSIWSKSYTAEALTEALVGQVI